MDIKVGFVVLHYITFEMTKDCVDLLVKTFQNVDYQIVVVDNGSSNDSGILLKESYKNNDRINVILNEINVGFARGNNIGYEFLIKNFNLNYIVILNNDVLINDEYFFQKVNSLFARTNFAILGPDIYSPRTGIHQNPVSLNLVFDLNNIDKRIRKLEWITSNFNLNYRIYSLFTKASNKIYSVFTKKVKKELYLNEHIDPLLHGACYIFSENFISKRKYAFNPSTFLYFEEDILKVEADHENMIMLYSPEIKVNHLEDVSTNAISSNKMEKIQRKMMNQLNSARIYKQILLNLRENSGEEKSEFK